MEASGVHSSCEVVLQKISIVLGLHPYIPQLFFYELPYIAKQVHHIHPKLPHFQISSFVVSFSSGKTLADVESLDAVGRNW